MLKALSASLLNFSIILLPRERVASLTSNSSELLIWGVLHGGAAKNQFFLGSQRNHSIEKQETRRAPLKVSPNIYYCYHPPLFSLSPFNDAFRAFTMNLIDLAVPKTLSEISLNYLDL